MEGISTTNLLRREVFEKVDGECWAQTFEVYELTEGEFWNSGRSGL
jgi:hypothetical protein